MGGGQPESQSMKAKLWGDGIDGLGGGRFNGWEIVVYPTYVIAAAVLCLGVGYAPDTSIKTWAKQEARVRLDLKEQGVIGGLPDGAKSLSEAAFAPDAKSVLDGGGVAAVGGEFGVHYDTDETTSKYHYSTES